jgi:hypothetical protein
MGISLIERVCGKVAVPLKMKGLVSPGNLCRSARIEQLRGRGKTMKFRQNVLVAMLTVGVSSAATIPNATEAQMVVTLRPSSGHSEVEPVEASEIKVELAGASAPVVGLKRLSGNLADTQLFVLLDDSTRSSSLGTQLPELKTFIESLPVTTQIAVGYMRNGSFGMVQTFTADHQKASSALRLPLGIPGGNASPYFALTDLAKHWPSKEPADRRAVLMLTDGVDRYYGNSMVDDPYVDEAIHDTLKNGVMVYSIYLRGAGVYGRGGWSTNFAQSRLMDVSDETGGHAYFEDLTDPVSIAPFLKDFEERLSNQYQLTIQALNGKGIQPVKVRTELPGVKIQAPTRVYVP